MSEVLGDLGLTPPERVTPKRRPSPSLVSVDRTSSTRSTKAGGLSDPSVRLTRGDTVTLEPVAWLWRWFLPAGMFTVLGGAPGCGKTSIALSLAATTTTGGTWPDGTRCQEAGDVLLWSGEDANSVLAARLAACGADMTRVHFVDGVGHDGSTSFDPGVHMALLEATAATLTAPRLLVIDPIVSAVVGDGHKSNDVRRALQPVVTLAQNLGCAVIGITHFSKGTGGRDPIERITGSLAYGALARVVFVAANVKSEDGAGAGDVGDASRRVFMRAKSNIGPDHGGFTYDLARKDVAFNVEGQYVEWGQAIAESAREVLDDAEADPASGDIGNTHDTDDALKRAIGTTWAASKDVERSMRDAGFTPKQTRAARERLRVVTKRQGFGSTMASYWKLPEGVEVPPDPEDDTTPVVPAEHQSCPYVPTKTEGSNGHDCNELGTNEVPSTDVEVFE